VLVVGPLLFSFSSRSLSQRECLEEQRGNKKNVPPKKYSNFLLLFIIVYFDSVTVALVSKSNKQQISASNANSGGSTGTDPPTDPSPPQDEERYEEVIDYLVNIGVATRTTLEEDPESPQYKAANWIANVDGFQIPLPSGVGVDAAVELPMHTRFAERYALAVFYYALGGESWRYGMRFLQPRDHCEWYQDFVTTAGTVLRLGVSECQALGSGFEDKFVHGLSLRT
jgi:hypothetical protein